MPIVLFSSLFSFPGALLPPAAQCPITPIIIQIYCCVLTTGHAIQPGTILLAANRIVRTFAQFALIQTLLTIAVFYRAAAFAGLRSHRRAVLARRIALTRIFLDLVSFPAATVTASV